MSDSRRCLPPVLLALGILAFFAGRARAFEKAGSLNGVDYRFICADWALLKEKINAPVILSRPPGAPGGKKTVRLALDFPAAFKAAAVPAGMRASLGIEPGETKRFAFKACWRSRRPIPASILLS